MSCEIDNHRTRSDERRGTYLDSPIHIPRAYKKEHDYTTPARDVFGAGHGIETTTDVRLFTRVSLSMIDHILVRAFWAGHILEFPCRE